MKGLEELIRSKLIPAIFGGNGVSGEMRKILQLPARMGGMGFLDPTKEAEWEYENSKMISAPVSEAICNHLPHLDIDRGP